MHFEDGLGLEAALAVAAAVGEEIDVQSVEMMRSKPAQRDTADTWDDV